MRSALERIDISETVARRKLFEFATLAGVVCGLIGYFVLATTIFFRDDYYKGLLYISAGIIVFAFSLSLRTLELKSAIFYINSPRSGERTENAASLQLFSEVTVLSGAGIFIVNAVLAVLTEKEAGPLSLLGLIILILGVKLSLRVKELIYASACELRGRGRSPLVLLLPSSGDDVLRSRGRFSWLKKFIS